MSRLHGNVNGMNWIRQEKRLAIYLRDGFRCQYCACDLREVKRGVCTLDHLRPRSFGGTHAATNLVTACITCNAARSDRKWTEFASPEAVVRIQAQRRKSLNLSLAKSILAGVMDRVELLRSL